MIKGGSHGKLGHAKVKRLIFKRRLGLSDFPENLPLTVPRYGLNVEADALSFPDFLALGIGSVSKEKKNRGTCLLPIELEPKCLVVSVKPTSTALRPITVSMTGSPEPHSYYKECRS